VAYAPLTIGILDDPALRAFYPYDTEKAKHLLEQAGWKATTGGGIRERHGQQLAFVISVADVGGGPWPGAQMLQAQLRELGFDVTIKAQARAPTLEDRYKCRTNGSITALRGENRGILYYAFHSSLVGSNFNYSCYSNPSVDALLEQGRQEGDVEKQRQIYLMVEKRLLEEAVTVPLMEDWAVWAVHKTVQGFKFNG
jgi:peptide/nickel transport system substrate-binding protein